MGLGLCKSVHLKNGYLFRIDKYGENALLRWGLFITGDVHRGGDFGRKEKICLLKAIHSTREEKKA